MPILDSQEFNTPQSNKPRSLWFILVFLFILIFLISGGMVIRNALNERREQAQERERLARLAQKPQVKVTLIEGKTVGEYFKILEEKDLGKADDLNIAVRSLDRSSFALLPSQKENADLQGFLFPDTYQFEIDSSAEIILSKLVGTFFSKLENIESQKNNEGRYIVPGYENLKYNGQSGLSLNEVVTLASIVEKETGRPGEDASGQRLQEERKLVAGVFLNRLIINQALESDATVNFVTNAGRASPTFKDLEVDSAYYTYKNAGLPPSPISNPSFSSLNAVLNPTKSDFYYFLHKQPSGEAVFSKTLVEHLANKQKYLK